MNDDPLLVLRNKINIIDSKILSLLSKRRLLSLDIAQIKIKINIPIRDKKRENHILEYLINEGKKYNLDRYYIIQLFKIIIEDSVLSQQILTQTHLNYKIDNSAHIAFLGPTGSYSHLLAKEYGTRYFKNIVEYNCKNFSDIIQAVEKKQVKYGILPIENNSSGPIYEVYDLLQHTNLLIIEEVIATIDHCILALDNVSLDQLETIYSHYQPLQQCSYFLSQFPNWKKKYCDSTSAAIKKIIQLNKNTIAALGSKYAGKIYNLKILKHNITNQKKNITRFIILARNAIKINELMTTKIIFLIKINKKSYTFLEVLLILRKNNISIINFQSRPIVNNSSSEEMFFIDIKVNYYIKIQKVLDELKTITTFLKILGQFPNETIISINL